MLLRLEITDPRWLEAMRAIRDAMRVEGSKTYVRCHRRTALDSLGDELLVRCILGSNSQQPDNTRIEHALIFVGMGLANMPRVLSASTLRIEKGTFDMGAQ